MDKEVIKKYNILIQDVENYVLKKNGRRKATRKHWTPEDREKWKLRYPECPLCHESYDESNPITKEHITPLFLGGPERDCNVIAICHKCNKSRDNVMKKLLATTDIAQIRERWPAIKPAVDNFVIWCHITLYDYDNLHQVKDLNHAFKNERNIDLAVKNKDNFLINNAKSFFPSILDSLRNITRKKDMPLNSGSEIKLDSISSIMPVEKTNTSSINDNTIIRPDVIFDLNNWVLENWKNKSDYNKMKTPILRHEKDNGGNRKLRTILKDDFDIPKSWSVKKISSYFEDLKSNIQSSTVKPQVNTIQEKEPIAIPSRDNLKVILAKNITKRIGANTYKDGFKISQIAYIFKQSKEKYKVSWNKFFTHLGVKHEENVETTCKKLLLELDLTIEESLDENGNQIYLFSESN